MSSTNSSPSTPEKVSCLVVTANRKKLLKRSLHSYKNQTYPNKELVIIDNGRDQIDDLLADFSSDEVQYVRVKPSSDNILGDLRNISLEHATGKFLTCWDDDDWFHPERIKTQVNILKKGYDACCLTGNLFHIDSEEFLHHPYRGALPDGSPNSIMHRRNSEIRYPSLRRDEDTVYLNQWKKKRYKKLALDFSYLLVRCFHGSNTWEQDHFLRRLRNSPLSFVQYVWYAKVLKDLFKHPKFILTEQEKKSFNMFLKDSATFDLV